MWGNVKKSIYDDFTANMFKQDFAFTVQISVAEKKKEKNKPYKRKLVICHPDLTQHKIFRTRGHICTAEKGKKLHVKEIENL